MFILSNSNKLQKPGFERKIQLKCGHTGRSYLTLPKLDIGFRVLRFNLTLNPKPYPQKNKNRMSHFPYFEMGSHLGQHHMPY